MLGEQVNCTMKRLGGTLETHDSWQQGAEEGGRVVERHADGDQVVWIKHGEVVV